MPLTVDVVTIERQVYSEDDVDLVHAPGIEGEMGILPRHEPVITALKPGVLEITRGDARDHIAVGGGYIEITGRKVTVLADVAERADEIDAERAEAARRRAEQALEEAPSRVEAEQALSDLQRARARLKVAEQRRRRRRRGSSGGPSHQGGGG